jgi:hypothetical protein
MKRSPVVTVLALVLGWANITAALDVAAHETELRALFWTFGISSIVYAVAEVRS